MEIGLHVANFTWPGGLGAIAEQLTRVVTTAEDVGMSRVGVMDHVWQIGPLGPPEEPMLEAYTTLGYLAARTSRVELLAWVTAVSYRDPGLLAKIISTLDVLSNGRAWLSIGAAWNGEESEGLGCSSHRPPSGSSGWRRRCASACRCGATTTACSRARTTAWAAR